MPGQHLLPPRLRRADCLAVLACANSAASGICECTAGCVDPERPAGWRCDICPRQPVPSGSSGSSNYSDLRRSDVPELVHARTAPPIATTCPTPSAESARPTRVCGMYVTAQNQCAAPLASSAVACLLRVSSPTLSTAPLYSAARDKRCRVYEPLAKWNNRGSYALRTATRRIKGPHHNPNVSVCKGTLNTLILQVEALEGSFCRISAPPIRTC